MAPDYQRPALPVRDAYAPAAAPIDAPQTRDAAAAASPAALDWHDYFADAALRGLIEQGLDTNRDLRMAAARVAQAQAAYRIQGADLWPTVVASAGETGSRVPGDLNLTGRPVIGSQYQAGLGLSVWELDFWGRLRSLREAALDDYLATEAAQRAVAQGLVAQIAQTYLALRDLDERITLMQRTVDSRAESLRIFRRREAVGSASKLELTEVTTLWQQARALQTQLEQDRATQFDALQLLVGRPIQLPSEPGHMTDGELMHELDPGLPSALLENRPDIAAAEFQLKAAHANIGAARAAFFPQITLTGSVGTASAELSGLFKGGSLAWSFTPSLTLPLFDAGRLRGNLALSEARRVEAVAQYEKTVQAAFRDVADALAARRWLAEQVAILQDTEAAQAERLRLAKLRYDNGATAFLEVLDAQRDLLAIEQQVVQSRRALLASRVSLYIALGGGGDALVTGRARPTPTESPAPTASSVLP